VGGIDLIWNYEEGAAAPYLGVDLEMDQMDPLNVDPPSMYYLDEWEDRRRGADPELADPFQLDLAPDYLHKGNISGGPPYGIVVPFAGADPMFANEEHSLPFVDYLRLCFRWGGFPRLERHADRADVVAFVAEMTSGVEPF
jgi:hypothetical protein